MRLDVWALFPVWVRFLLSDRKEVVVALDWTDFDSDGHSTIALNMITSHATRWCASTECGLRTAAGAASSCRQRRSRSEPPAPQLRRLRLQRLRARRPR